MLSYTNWLNENFTIPTDKRSFEQVKEQLLLFCIDPTSIFNKDTDNLQLYTQIYNTNTLDELKPYLVWIKKGDSVDALVKWFKLFTAEEKNTKFLEDYGVISDTLQKYKQTRNTFRLMPDPETGDLKDYSIYKNILQFKTLNQFYDVMAIFQKEQTKSEKLREIKEDVLVVEYTDNLKILVPLTEDASKIYGKGTQWCTAADNNNMFIKYAEEGPLFILIKDGDKYQFHIESKSYMDAQDQHIKYYNKIFVDELNLIKKWRTDNLKTYFDIMEFSKADIHITEDNIKYAKYLKYNTNTELRITYTYLNQQFIDILDSLTCNTTIYLNTETDYKGLNNTRKYTIICNYKTKEYFRDELRSNPEYFLNLYYKVNGTYKIIDEKIYINGNLELKKKYTKMPEISIAEVSGNFDCSNNELKTLKGCPEIIGGNFYCSYNELESLEYGPKQVNSYYYCTNNKLKTLKGCPEIIGSHFNCSKNLLESLENGPKRVNGNYNCHSNKLKTLKGCAEIINGSFDCSWNNLKSLEYGPKQVGGYYNCGKNTLKTLKGCAEIIGNWFDCSNNELESLEYGPKQVNGSYFCSNNNIILQKPANIIIKGNFYNLNI